MKKMTLFSWSLFMLLSTLSQGQSKEEISKTVDEINRMIDRAVVKKDIATLQKHYADDFFFTHGTGNIDSKESWIRSIQNTPEGEGFISREHDSTLVEPHHDIAIVTGKLSVARQSKEKLTKYALKYVRVFAFRKNVWQLISHRTYIEWH